MSYSTLWSICTCKLKLILGNKSAIVPQIWYPRTHQQFIFVLFDLSYQMNCLWSLRWASIYYIYNTSYFAHTCMFHILDHTTTFVVAWSETVLTLMHFVKKKQTTW